MNDSNDRLFDLLSMQSNSLTTEEILQALNFIVNDDKVMDAAIDILDRMSSKISVIRSPNFQIKIWKVQGSSGQYYNCLKSFCQCKSYYDLNQSSKTIFLCKHLVALRLSNCLKLFEEFIVQDEEYIHILCNLSKSAD